MNAKILIGRDRSKCHLILPDMPQSRLSRIHAVIEMDNSGQLWITDCSTNGTSLNDKILEKNKPYKLKVRDRVVFANEHQLDWKALLKLVPTGTNVKENVYTIDRAKEKPIRSNPNNQRGRTNIHNEAAKLFLSVIEWQERVTLFRLFLRSLSHPSKKLYGYYNNQSNWISPNGAYLFSLTLLFISQKIAGDGVFLKNVPEYLQDFLPALYGALLIVFGYIIYVFFRLLTKKHIHPKQYFYPYIALTAISNIFTAVFFPICVSINEILGGILLLMLYLWIFYHSVTLQSITWEISFGRTIFYNSLLSLMAFAIVFILLSFFATIF